jgi:hypothetical protein
MPALPIWVSRRAASGRVAVSPHPPPNPKPLQLLTLILVPSPPPAHVRGQDENNLAGVKLEESSHRLTESAVFIKTREDAQASLQAKLQRLMDADK